MESNETRKQKFINLGFFKMIWYSITKFEKYPEMAASGVKKAILYFIKLMLIFCVCFSVIYFYYVDKVAKYEENDLDISKKIIYQVESIAVDEDQKALVGKMLEEYSKNGLISMIIVSILITFFFSTLLDVLTLSLFGIITCFISKIKINYKALFNMSIFAMTLSIILKLLYFALLLLANFEIKYFDVVYAAVSYISLTAAIFMIKSDIIKQNLELMKIIENSKQKIEETITIPKRPKDEEENKEEKEEKKEDKKEKEGTEEQGSNA